MLTDRSGWAHRLRLEPVTPTTLGFIRLWLFGAVAVWAVLLHPGREAEIAGLHWSPRSLYRLLPGPPSATTLQAVRILVVISAAICAIGLFTRVAQMVATPAAIALMGLHEVNLGKIYHVNTLPVLLLLSLLPARLGDGLSIDRLRRARRGVGAPGRDFAYAWPIALAQMVVVLVYVGAGWAKVRNGGLAWLQPESFQRWGYVKLDRMADPSPLGLWIARNPAAALATSVGLLAFELSMALVLVIPRWRIVAVASILAFHIPARIAFGFDFTFMMAVAWVPLVDVPAVGRWLAGQPALARGRRCLSERGRRQIRDPVEAPVSR